MKIPLRVERATMSLMNMPHIFLYYLLILFCINTLTLSHTHQHMPHKFREAILLTFSPSPHTVWRIFLSIFNRISKENENGWS